MYYNREIKELAQEFSTDLKSGLTEQQVTENLAKYGPNELEQTKKQSIIVRFFLQFKDALTIILIIAAVVSIIVEPTEWIDSAIIVFVVVVNAILGLVQENNAERALEALQKMASPKAKVIREGNIITINASQVVPGDLLVLEAGDCIASDGRLVECFNLKVDESALTGESVPVEKISSILDKEEIPLAERNNMVYASCNVTYGRGIAIVTTTGEENEVGKIATMIQQTKRENTPLQDQLDQIGRTIGVICIIICIVVFGMELLEGLSILEAFKTSIALAVAAIPEVRSEMVKEQRKIATQGGIVMDGRDIGTTVLPNAPVKIFLVASAHERARRRFEENQAKGIATSTLEELQRAIELRDQKDSTRKVSPLTKAKDAIEIDSTHLTINQVVSEISKIIEKKCNN